MKVNETIRDAVGLALAAGAAGALLPAAAAVAQQPASGASGTETLGEVTVTGSRIRRIDAETASPVFVIDQSAIAQSGTTTLGDLVQKIPAIAGAAVNPQVNNGGGFGESNIELRGLNAKRTLILLNGRRIGLAGASGAVDVNQIPVSIIERVEVLKEGAGAVYGSDAIAGVVNFITRNEVDGFELGGDYGRTGESDGTHYSLNALWGLKGDKFNALLGASYMNQKKVSADNREFSRFAQYLYSGSIQQGGSSRIPTGRVFLPASGPVKQAFSTCSNSVTRIAGRPGTALTDYRCRTGADTYNYQPFNLLMTPQERSAVFTTLNYKFNEYVESYAEFLLNRTHSGYQIAPLPFDATSDDVIISKDSIYNIFGYDFGGFNTPNPNLRVRLESLGNRFSQSDSDSKIATWGFKGKFSDSSSWTWDANVQYARLDQRAKVNGYFFIPGLQAAVGPSFRDAGGTPRCGTPTAIINNCTPINLFNVQDPTQIANLQSVTTGYSTLNNYVTKGAALNFAGDLFQMPAGAVSLAVGAEYRKLEGDFQADYLVVAKPPLYTNCLLSSEACTGNTRGDYDDKELYFEAFFPLLKDAPGAEALNVTLGARRSDYNLFGSTTKGQFKVEYRPLRDLLVRGTYSQVFRVPTIADLFGAPAISNPTFADPCLRLTAAKIAANPGKFYNLACQNVPLTGGFVGDGTSQITSVIQSNPNLKPETGNVVTAGFVFSPSFFEGFQVSVDYWRYKVKDLISNIDTNYSINQCLNNGTPLYCNLVTRISSGVAAGRIAAFTQPTVNLGELNVNGIDLGLRYALRNTPVGSFQFSIDVTRTAKYENQAAPNVEAIDYAGLYDKQFGNISKLRGTISTGWAWHDFDALVAVRYIDKVKVLNADGAAPFDSPALDINSIWYTDLTLGYTLPWKTKVQLGVNNLMDKKPPLFYQNNVINANTDVSTYDSLGRRFFVSFNQKF